MRLTIMIIFLASLGIGIAFAWGAHLRKASQAYNQKAFKHEFVVIQAHHLMKFNLMDPEQAPHYMRDSVMRGYRLIMNTPFYAPNNALGQLSCTNCHFVGGDTLGGKNGGISLVGVTTEYPNFSKRAGRVITLAERVNNCFQRSMNGNPLPLNSGIMHDILNYLSWTSKEVEMLKNIPWLGLPEIKSSHHPNPVEGKKVYERCCMMCHQASGEGGGELGAEEGKSIPPLWGPHSFNDGAGMNTMRMLAPFVYLNMPYQQAILTEEEALDVAAYVLQQPRPHFSH